MTNGFDGRVAIVTGGGKGIGGASAAALLDAGAKVEVFDIDCRSGAHLEGRPGYGCTQVDVRDAGAARAAVVRVAATHGGTDSLATNAGIVARQTLDAMAPADWQRILDVNLTGSFNCAQSVVAHMKRRRSGAIVNIASVAGKNISGTGGVHYTASKWGVVGLTRHLAYELAPWHIRVNTVCPGPVLTDLIHAVMDGPAKDRFAAAVPLGRWVMPEDIAGAVMFFLSQQSAMCTGSELVVDGGILIGSGHGYEGYFAGRNSPMPERDMVRPGDAGG